MEAVRGITEVFMEKEQQTESPAAVRISKYFTDCGLLSRRAAEAAITDGDITVNGIPAVLGQKIIPGKDSVCYRGTPVLPRAQETGYRYLMLNKPRGYVTTLSDERGRKTVATLCASAGIRVYPVGRLDMDSDGLLLLTDDGAFAQRLTHPSHPIAKYYEVTLRGQVDDKTLQALSLPHLLDGYRTHPAEVVRLNGSGAPDTRVGITLHEGRNRQIRRLCAAHGLQVLRLCRTALLCENGKAVRLGNLPVGKWRDLTKGEINLLKGNGIYAGSASDTE